MKQLKSPLDGDAFAVFSIAFDETVATSRGRSPKNLKNRWVNADPAQRNLS